MNWSDRLDNFGKDLLSAMNYDPYHLPTSHNPITRVLKSGVFVDVFGDLKGFNRTSVSRVATICQMAVYDAQGGPDGDGERKGLRRQWYSWFKTRFAQPFSKQLGEEEFKGLNWNGRMSQVYSCLVNTGSVTYWDLWVDDASRMMERNWAELFSGCHIIVAVEKDSLFGDFIAPTKALGAVSLVSGKGKQSRAATEKLLREHFNWRNEFDNPFSADNPLIVLHITDHDMDGERVIGPTFGTQARRYTEHVLEARVGIKPEMVDDWQGSWYEVKTTNQGYITWAESKGLFLAECPACGHTWAIKGTTASCPDCGTKTALTIKIDDSVVNQPFGFEVEALPTRSYYTMLVDALLQVLPFDYIVSRLRDECTADAYEAAEQVKTGILENNDSYKALLAEFDRLEEIKARFEREIAGRLQELGEPHQHDWRDEDNDPQPEGFRGHVGEATGWSEPWRPFDRDDRTRKLVEFLRATHSGQIVEFENKKLDW